MECICFLDGVYHTLWNAQFCNDNLDGASNDRRWTEVSERGAPFTGVPQMTYNQCQVKSSGETPTTSLRFSRANAGKEATFSLAFDS